MFSFVCKRYIILLNPSGPQGTVGRLEESSRQLKTELLVQKRKSKKLEELKDTLTKKILQYRSVIFTTANITCLPSDESRTVFDFMQRRRRRQPANSKLAMPLAASSHPGCHWLLQVSRAAIGCFKSAGPQALHEVERTMFECQFHLLFKPGA